MNLLLSLGHNSSAILVDNNGNVLDGVEEERLSRVKSDSRFPRLAIEHVLMRLDGGLLQNIFISHWFDDFNFIKEARKDPRYTKYFDFDYFDYLVTQHTGCQVALLSSEFTHHDAHASSAVAFYKNFCPGIIEDSHIIVADGFGNKQEVLSIYKVINDSMSKVKKIYGYKNSLGLLYQYATTYCGMKAIKDEWKFLAYERHIMEEFNKKQIEECLVFAKQAVKAFLSVYLLMDCQINSIKASSSFVDLELLEATKNNIYLLLNKLTKDILLLDDVQSYRARIAVGFFVQNVVENVIVAIIKHHNIKNLLVAGGIFYNVKLNNCCLKNIKGKFSVIPLAGDQGAAIGLYYNVFKKFNFDNLCWGKRNLTKPSTKLPRVIYFSSQNKLVNTAVELLQQDHIVQLIIGKGEFGPRALCHTSSLFLPQKYNANINDAQNGRLSLMPLAPVILARNLEFFFNNSDYSRVVGSDKYMIITYDYKKDILYDQYNGVMHKYPMSSVYSGRPQVIDNKSSTIYKILDVLEGKVGIKALVNTSFNIHLQPMVFSINDAIENFKFQQEKCPVEYRGRTYLLIGGYYEE